MNSNQALGKSDSATAETPLVKLSAGGGIALCGIWIACAAVTITIFLATFLFIDYPEATEENTENVRTWVILLCVCAVLPMVAAYKITKTILGKDS